MAKFIALLRAVNVGGTGKLPMADLKSLCVDAGFEQVEIYIASGNVVFESKDTAARVRSEMLLRLQDIAAKPIQVFIRTAAEMRAALRANPFPEADPARTYAFFLSVKPPRDALANIRRREDEKICAGKREIYVQYPLGMGQSKLVIPAAVVGTARNMKTVAKLVKMSS